MTLIPSGKYKVVCTDHKIVTAKTDIKGVELTFKVIRPLKKKSPVFGKLFQVGGREIKHIFWVTEKMLPYLARDGRVIRGRKLRYLRTFAKRRYWIGQTCEISVKDETFRGVTVSRVRYFDPWKPAKKLIGGAR